MCEGEDKNSVAAVAEHSIDNATLSKKFQKKKMGFLPPPLGSDKDLILSCVSEGLICSFAS